MTLPPPEPGHFWKTPFVQEPPQAPADDGVLRFAPAPPGWLAEALAQVMASGPDESDRAAVQALGAAGAAAELLQVDPEWFRVPEGGWRQACDAEGRAVGFVLPVTMVPAHTWRDGRPQGTVYYMGVLPALRGRGHGGRLLAEAGRAFAAAGCWRGFCDASSANAPMLAAFRRAGWQERPPWQRPLR